MWALINKENRKIEYVLLPMTPPEIIEKAKDEFDVITVTTENGPFIVGEFYEGELERKNNG